MTLTVCVVCASPRGVGVDRRRACPHRRDVGSWYTARCQWCRDRLGHNGPASLCVCVAIAVVGPTMVIPQDRGKLVMIARFGCTFGVFVSLRCSAFATGGLVQHGDTPQ